MLKRFGSRLFSRKAAPRVVEAAETAAADAVEAGASIPKTKTAQVAPALLLATGAGVAFWYWTQWARGQAESDQAESDQAAADKAAGGD